MKKGGKWSLESDLWSLTILSDLDVCIWSKIQDNAGRQSTTLSVPSTSTPGTVIAELLNKM